MLFYFKGPGGSVSKVVGLPNNSYKPIANTAWVRTLLCKLQKGCTRLAAASDRVYQLFPHGRWLSLGTPTSFTLKTGRHDIAERGVKYNKLINQFINICYKKKKKKTSKNFIVYLQNQKNRQNWYPKTEIHDNSLFWLDTGTPITSGGV